MLVDLKAIRPRNIPLASGETLHDLRLPPPLLEDLNDLLSSKGYRVSKYSTSVSNGANVAVFPNQYFRFAALLYDFAISLNDYFKVLDRLRGKGLSLLVGNAQKIRETVEGDNSLKSEFDCDNDIVLFSKFIDRDNDDYRFNAKRLINDQGAARGSSDCFASVILKNINLPDSSSSIFGHLVYELAQVPELYARLQRFFSTTEGTRTQHNVGFPIDFENELKDVDLQIPRIVIANYISSLQTKPFLILTGLSGSGKTQLAMAFAKWISASKNQYALIAVGADWTSNENLLGYPDALNPGQYRKPDNGALDLILRAKEDPDHPYFLILDEMNLSHVERYFADFLSAMESGEPISLHDGGESDLWSGVPGKLTIPDNVFVVGTVNVDETTYMFSPKVLDRANVIEFRVSANEMDGFLQNPAKPDLDQLEGNGADYALEFLAATRSENIELDEATRTFVSKELMRFFPLLQKAGAEFGYRTAHEICRFMYFYGQLAKSTEGSTENDMEIMRTGMDAAVMQKLLPKLHGSKKKLAPVLDSLAELCVADHYPTSAAKITRMQQRLLEHGFTSFAEA